MRQGLAVGTASLCLHAVLIAGIPAAARRSADARAPSVELTIEAPVHALEPARDAATKEPIEGIDEGAEPAPEGRGEGPGRRIGELARPRADTAALAGAYTDAMADTARALAFGPVSPSVIAEGTDLGTAAPLMGGSLAGLEQLGHAPALGCPIGAACGEDGPPALSPSSARALAAVRTDAPCHGMHVCPRPRIPRVHVEVVIRGALEPLARHEVRAAVHRAVRRCVSAAGPRERYRFALSTRADGAVRTIDKLDAAFEGTARQSCLAAALAALTLPAARGDSAILATIRLP